jgi:hypothetical protein
MKKRKGFIRDASSTILEPNTGAAIIKDQQRSSMEM